MKQPTNIRDLARSEYDNDMHEVKKAWLTDSILLIRACLIAPELINEAYLVEPRHMFGCYVDVWKAVQQCSLSGAVDLRRVLAAMPTDWRNSEFQTQYNQNDLNEIRKNLTNRNYDGEEVVPSTEYVQMYVNRILDSCRRITDFETGIRLATAATHPTEDIDEAEAKAIDSLMSVTPAENDVVWLSDIGTDIQSELAHNIENPADIRGMVTGLNALDRAVGGFEKSNYIIIGARPSIGKSTLTFEIVKRLAMRGAPGAIITTETSKRMFLIRMACSQVGINYQDEWKRGRLRRGNEWRGEESTWDVLTKCVDELSKLEIAHISASHTPRQLYALARRLKSARGIEWLGVDTINLLPSDGNSYNEHAAITDRSKRLSAIAHELDVMTIVTWQLNRTVESTSDKIPTLAHLRESGSAEEHADIALLLYRPEYYTRTGQSCKTTIGDESIGDNEMVIIIAKNRDGEAGRMVKLGFDKEYARISNLRGN